MDLFIFSYFFIRHACREIFDYIENIHRFCLLFRAKCSVLYLGTAISSVGQRGIDAIQEPLSRRYPVDGKEVVRGM